jgi:hypothetical protein
LLSYATHYVGSRRSCAEGTPAPPKGHPAQTLRWIM